MPVLRQLDGCLFSARLVKGRNKSRGPGACTGGNGSPECRQAPDRNVVTLTIEIEERPAKCDHGHDVLLAVRALRLREVETARATSPERVDDHAGRCGRDV